MLLFTLPETRVPRFRAALADGVCTAVAPATADCSSPTARTSPPLARTHASTPAVPSAVESATSGSTGT